MIESREILLILHLPPPVHGASLVGKSIQDSELINDDYKCNYINLSSAKNLSEIGKFNLTKLISFLSIYWKVFRTLILTKPDLCYVTINSKGSPFYKDFGIVLLLKLFRKTIVYHFHNKGVSLYQHRAIDNILYRITFKKTYTILMSPLLLPDMNKYLADQNTFYCPNGIPVNDEFRKTHSISGPCRLLFVSNMMKAKGVLDLLAALEVLNKRGLHFVCDFVGKWFDVDELSFQKELEEKGLTEKVFAHGAKYGDAKNQFYKNADVFIFPTHDEAFPLVLLEAMQHELPVISTGEAAIPEIVDHGRTGLIIEKEDINDLANRIEYLIVDPDKRKEFGRNGLQKFHKCYTIQRFENNLKGIFDRIISKNE